MSCIDNDQELDVFAALIRRAGLSLSPTEVAQVREAWVLVEPMLERVRSIGGDRSRQPAQVFHAIHSRPTSKPRTS
jgi:hypothetical protein